MYMVSNSPDRLPLGLQQKTGEEAGFLEGWHTWDGSSAIAIPIQPQIEALATEPLPPPSSLPDTRLVDTTADVIEQNPPPEESQRIFLRPSTFDSSQTMAGLPDLLSGTSSPTHSSAWLPGQVAERTFASTDGSTGASAQRGNASVADVLTPVAPAPVTNLLGRPIHPNSPEKPSKQKNASTTAPHIVEERTASRSAVGRLGAAARAGMVASFKGWHLRYTRFLLDPTETRPMKQAPYVLLGMHAVARCVETTIPVLSTIDEAITSSEGMWVSLGAISATAYFTWSETRNYPNEPIDKPISARITDSMKRNLRHPFAARRVREKRRAELVNIRAEHKAATHSLASWARKEV